VLCQQVLAGDAATRMSLFEAYVQGTLTAEATAAEASLTAVLAAIAEVPDVTARNNHLDLANLMEPDLRQRVHACYAQLAARRAGLLVATAPAELPPMPVDDLLAELEKRETELALAADAFDQDAMTDKRKELQQQQHELLARKWLSQQKLAVVAELGRLKRLELLEKARGLAKTAPLSKKKAALAETLITDAFISRFQKELKALGASHLQVAIRKTTTTKGQVRHQVALQNTKLPVKTGDVFSEGELRIVSLAAFLADVTSHGSCTPFIFDDPISSLDQVFEEATAERLIELSTLRQVIVFTHRLSLLVMLKEADKKRHGKQSKPRIIALQRQAWGTGDPCDPMLPTQNPKEALNTLYDHRLGKARNVYQTEGFPSYSAVAQALCSDIRTTIERLIENELLADVVQRYRRGIQTMNKLEKLANINSDDCTLLDAMMTKYSRYEHSQPNEAPVALPLPDEFNEDLLILKTWLQQFSQRPLQKSPGASSQKDTSKPASPQHAKISLLPPGAVPVIRPPNS
jgi:hypothetical protein